LVALADALKVAVAVVAEEELSVPRDIATEFNVRVTEGLAVVAEAINEKPLSVSGPKRALTLIL
jgi:hypothetical protein